MRKRTTHEQFVSDINRIYGEEYEIHSAFLRSSEKVKILHNKCGNYFYAEANAFKRKRLGCPQCSKSFIYTTENLKNYLKNTRNDEYELVSECTNSTGEILIKHKQCGNIYKTKGTYVINGQTCVGCKSNKPLTQEDFIKRISKKYNNSIEVLSEYKSLIKLIIIKHIKCGHIIYTRPKELLEKKYKCHSCERYEGKNKTVLPPKKYAGETRIKNYLDKYGIKYKTQYSYQDCVYKQQLRFDFAIFNDSYSKLLFLVEYDGVQHFEPVKAFGGVKEFNLNKIRDEIKDNYCKQNNIDLVRIPYFEFGKIEEILTASLLELFYKNKNAS